MNRIDAIHSLVAFAQTYPDSTEMSKIPIGVENLVLLLETAEAADVLMGAIDDEGDIPGEYWARLGLALAKLTAEESVV